MIVHTENSVYEVHVGEGFTCRFRWLRGTNEKHGYGENFGGELHDGVINRVPTVGRGMRISLPDDLVRTSKVISIEPDPEVL